MPAPTLPTPDRRADLDALRALAIVLVVAFHAGVRGFQAGFIGVDVFFVISGYLITRLIEHEIDSTGTLRFGAFWSRRVRRLLPAATLVITVTALASFALANPLDWHSVAQAAVAAGLYASNLLFAHQATNYFAQAIGPSPLLHTWSLAVEEQFYLVWPILIWLVSRVGRGIDRRRATKVVSLVAVTVVSFALSDLLTNRGTPWAFYSSPTRAWEFGIGALVAVADPTLRRIAGRRGLDLLGLVGIGLIVFSMATMDGSTPFPGVAALAPVVGTACLLSWRPAATSAPGRIMRWGPITAIGRISYSWYLWHWPVIVLVSGYLGSPGLAVRVALAVGSLAPAYLTYRYVEQPIRHSDWVIARGRRALALAVSLIVVVALGAGLLIVVGRHVTRSPKLVALAAVRADVPSSGQRGCDGPDVSHLLSACSYGPSDGRRVLLIGDSHAGMWQPALSAQADAAGLRVIVRSRGNCPAIPVAIVLDGRSSSVCSAWQAATMAVVDAVHPAVVVIGDSSEYLDSSALGGQGASDAQWSAALVRLSRQLAARHVALLDLLDIPRLSTDPVSCIALHDAASCAEPASAATALARRAHAIETDALRTAGHGQTWNPLPYICHDAICPLVKDGRYIYRDGNHLTTRFATTLGRILARAVVRAAG